MEIQSGILTIHLFTNKQWIEIAKCLQANPALAQKICTRVKVKKEVTKNGEHSAFGAVAGPGHSEACAGLGNMIN